MCKYRAQLLGSCFGVMFAGVMPSTAYADTVLEERCTTLMERDLAYSARVVKVEGESGPRFAVPGGPVELLIKDVFSGLDGKLADRLKTGFIVEFITLCRNTPDQSAIQAVAETKTRLRLNPNVKNWGIREIDTGKLLNGTCEEFVIHVQENGIGTMFYNDPVRVTLDAYWTRFALNDEEWIQIDAVEADAQFACSLEPEKTFIDVLDAAASEYQLFRTH
jgi:hypothetical protein